MLGHARRTHEARTSKHEDSSRRCTGTRARTRTRRGMHEASMSAPRRCARTSTHKHTRACVRMDESRHERTGLCEYVPHTLTTRAWTDNLDTHARTHAHTHARTHAHMHARTHKSTKDRGYEPTLAQRNARTHAHKHARVRACTHTHTHTHTPVCCSARLLRPRFFVGVIQQGVAPVLSAARGKRHRR